MAAVAAVAGLVGAGISIYGDIKSANDQASLDQTRASIADQQSAEIASREQANEALRDQQAQRQKLQFGASYAASGKAGSGVGSQLQIQSQVDTQNVISAREASFQESMLSQQAGIDTALAGQSQTSGAINALGAGIGGVTKAASASTSGGSNPGYGGTQSMGAYPSLGVNINLAGSLGGGS